MKHYIKFISLICCLCLVFSALTGCKGKTADESKVTYDTGAEVEKLASSNNIAQNDNYTLGWNSEHCAVTLTSKIDGKVWSTLPADYMANATPEDLSTLEFLNSPIVMKHLNGENIKDAYAATSVMQNGRVSSKKMDNGVSVTYYFDDFLISVTVDYYLDGNSVKISIDPKKIVEGGVEQLLSVSVAPFMCAAKNTNAGSTDSYLVLPSGSGSIMYTDRRTDDVTREFSGDVYGKDLAVDAYGDPDNESKVSMPFFGIKNGGNALCAILEQGAESCVINAQAGSALHGYSSVYPTINFRGYDYVYLPGKHRIQYGNDLVKIDPVVIGYYPLSGNDANYTGVAKRYKDYLIEKGMTKSSENKLLSVKLVGSYVADELFLGFPSDDPRPLTTYKDAKSILEELSSSAGGSLVADLYGYGAGGVNGTKLAGDYKLTGVVGSKKDLKDLLSYTSSAGIDTYFNFDVVNFSKSGNGFSTTNDSALNIVGLPSPTRQFWRSTRARLLPNEGGVVGSLLSRNQLVKATNKVVKLTDKYGIKGLAFNTLGGSAYSDYDSSQYAVKSKMGSDVSKIISDIKGKKSVMVDEAYSYAAAASDVLTGCPTVSNQNTSFDADVPLYQIVFQGYKANYVSSINLATNHRIQFLKAIESGSGLSFTLSSSYEIELRKQYDTIFHATRYSDNQQYISDCLKEASGYLKSVAGAAIQSHSILGKNVTKTTFDNGVTVYVNYGDQQVTTDAGVIGSQSFKVK